MVGAEGTTTSGTSATTGSITISKAASGETYNIYRILDLESYSGSRKTGNYAYKLRTDTVTGSKKSWSEFIKSSEIDNRYVILDGEYVTWKEGASVKDFAKVALTYAKDSTTKINPDATQKLKGTDTNVTIEEKNGVPSVEKKVKKGSDYAKGNTASIGDKVEFQTTIIAQPGAQNYVLHDKMDAGLTFDNTSIKINLMKNGETKESLVGDTNYTVKTSGLESENPCTFHIEFKQDFCDKLKANDQIIITYSATLNENAVIAGEGNKNGTWLKYGDSSETKHDETTTKTFEIPVFKYTKGASGTGDETGLKDAQFILRKKGESSGMGLEPVTPTPNGKEGIVYCYKKNAAETIVITNDTGKFTIQGLAPGAYELVEKEAPKGYNKLSAPVEITIGNEGGVSYNTVTNAKWVKVENKTGSILPSTGGMGTTLFYIFGAILVIGSGVVLITKKRMK